MKYFQAEVTGFGRMILCAHSLEDATEDICLVTMLTEGEFDVWEITENTYNQTFRSMVMGG